MRCRAAPSQGKSRWQGQPRGEVPVIAPAAQAVRPAPRTGRAPRAADAPPCRDWPPPSPGRAATCQRRVNSNPKVAQWIFSGCGSVWSRESSARGIFSLTTAPQKPNDRRILARIATDGSWRWCPAVRRVVTGTSHLRRSATGVGHLATVSRQEGAYPARSWNSWVSFVIFTSRIVNISMRETASPVLRPRKARFEASSPRFGGHGKSSLTSIIRRFFRASSVDCHADV